MIRSFTVDRAFSSATPRIWNSLSDVIYMQSLSPFRHLLKTFLFQQTSPCIVFWRFYTFYMLCRFRELCDNFILRPLKQLDYIYSWWRGTVVERRSLAGELSLSCSRPASDEWPVIWVNRPLQVSILAKSAFILAGSISWVVSSNWMSALVALSGEYLWGEDLMWLIAAVVCSLVAAAGPFVRYRVQWMAALALQHHWLLPISCHFQWL